MRDDARVAESLVIAVVGATATGKSDLAVDLALAIGGEVVNADSMQLYAGMDVGTAKLTVEERRGVPHHVLDVWDVRRTASVAEYQVLARTAIDDVVDRGRTTVLVGGSGLYVRAVLDPIDFPGTDAQARAALEAELESLGPTALHERLAALDPAAAAAIQPANGRRIVRALEVVSMRGSFTATLPVYEYVRPTLQVGMAVDRATLDRRIDERVDRMWASGLVAEVEALAGRGLREGRTASRALGYAQVLAQLSGELTAPEARAATALATRRFARKQDSWFRRDPRVVWIESGAGALDSAVAQVRSVAPGAVAG